MTRHRRTWNWQLVAARAMLVSLFVVFVVGLSGPRGTSLAQDAGLESLKRQSLPWYDAASEQIKPVELEARDEPRSELRGTIAEKPPAQKKKRSKGFFERLFEDWNIDWNGSFATACYWLLWIAVGLGLVTLLIWTVRNVDIRQSIALDETTSARSRTQSVAQLPFQVDAGDNDFRSLVDKAVQSNDYRQAIVWLFGHVLVSLDQQNLIRLQKGKTNRQYLHELDGDRQLSDYYTDVMLPFEATFFGDKDLNREQFDRCWNGLNHFEQQIKGEGKAR